jgi:SAM-dependent methyltransferase
VTDGSDSKLDRPNLVYHEAQDRMALLPNYYGWIAARFAGFVKSGTVLELGCGAGFVLRHYVDRVRSVVAVDVNPELLERLGREYPPTKVEPRLADLRGDWHEIADVRADAVIALDVLEHFEDDRAFVRKVRERLNPGGPRGRQGAGAERALRADGPGVGALPALRRRAAARAVRIRGVPHAVRPPDEPGRRVGLQAQARREHELLEEHLAGEAAGHQRADPGLALLDHVPGLKGLSLVGVFERIGESEEPISRLSLG